MKLPPSRVCVRQGNSYVCVGRGMPTQVMALLGASVPAHFSDQRRRVDRLACLKRLPAIISDLSICGGHEPIWEHIVRSSPFAAATLPVYTIEEKGGWIDRHELLERCIQQIEGGVSILTIHATVNQKLLELAKSRLVPCTSRGGGRIWRDLQLRGSDAESAYIEILSDLMPYAKRHGTVLSLGATFRSANVFDSLDETQLTEIGMQIELAKHIADSGIGVMIEGPGHARPSSLRRAAKLYRQGGFPVMPLGPMLTDVGGAQDHINAAIGATLFGILGCAQVIAAVTRREHLGGIPTIEETIEAVEAAQLAGHIIDMELIDDLGEDRAAAEWRASHDTCLLSKSSSGCSRCGKFCPLVIKTAQRGQMPSDIET